MPEEFTVEEAEAMDVARIEVQGRFLLADYTVVGV